MTRITISSGDCRNNGILTVHKLITRDTVEETILKLQEKKRAAIESEEPLMNGPPPKNSKS